MTKDELIDKLDKAFEPLDDDFEFARLEAENRRLKQMLADSEAQNKRVLEKLDLIVRSNQELEKALKLACQEYDLYWAEKEAQKQKISLEDYFKEQAQKELKKDE